MDRRTELLTKIKSAGYPEQEVVLSLDEFFIGNNDIGSIGVNLYPNQPSLATFYKVFKELIQTGQIENVFIRIADVEDIEWFFTDTVFIIGDTTVDTLRHKVTKIQPSEIYSGWLYGLPANLHDNFSHKQVHSLWWD